MKELNDFIEFKYSYCEEVLFVLFLVSLIGCDGGWSIGGLEIK